MKKRFLVMPLLLLSFLCICTGCGERITSEATQEEIEKAISNGMGNGDFEELKNIVNEYNSDLSSYKNNDSFSKFLISEIEKSDSVKNDTELLGTLEDLQYKDKDLAEKVSDKYWGDDKDFKTKLSVAENFNKLEFYGPVEITSDDVDKYVAENEVSITMKNNEGGYYDDSNNRFKTKSRDIQSSGDIITTSAQYFGDFAILNTDREYLDTYYQIHHSYTHELYFRKCHLYDIDKIDNFKYAPPYLFSTYEGKTVIFEVDGKYSASIIYTVE